MSILTFMYSDTGLLIQLALLILGVGWLTVWSFKGG